VLQAAGSRDALQGTQQAVDAANCSSSLTTDIILKHRLATATATGGAVAAAASRPRQVLGMLWLLLLAELSSSQQLVQAGWRAVLHVSWPPTTTSSYVSRISSIRCCFTGSCCLRCVAAAVASGAPQGSNQVCHAAAIASGLLAGQLLRHGRITLGQRQRQRSNSSHGGSVRRHRCPATLGACWRVHGQGCCRCCVPCMQPSKQLLQVERSRAAGLLRLQPACCWPRWRDWPGGAAACCTA
jgi:hypothetical protein